ncbi:hypothetical protein K432DRAFT_444270 [Lepidopterella palustris CBS 459.81]|uniref:Transcriptional regulatory protein RXT2 N-terminal domain-containing protein n=1 Tax=Lepidopterella palustris CBS 459.81 TaxID=1314670 RepID=A0A8E2E7S0_9PEZI|nr:hypothetical protein K432DRAFT_444270 [Lepidopterella palustris CBS 459.81]
MAGQQQQIIDCIFNMKRKILRRDDFSDSDESDTPFTNRQHSLKRKTRYSQAGKADMNMEPPPPYKKKIEHAGYQRYILQRNPPRFDPDGDIVEYGDEYEDEEDLTTIEENAYEGIQLENILAPLTSAADLPDHPSMSIPYTSKHLTQLTADAGAISRKEQAALWRAKNLLTKLQGDGPWVPCGVMETSMDRFILDDRQPNGVASALSSVTQTIPDEGLHPIWVGNGTNSHTLMDPAGLRTPPPTSAPRQVPLLDVQMADDTNRDDSQSQTIPGPEAAIGGEVQIAERLPQDQEDAVMEDGTNGNKEELCVLQNGGDIHISRETVNGNAHPTAAAPENEGNLPSPPAEDNSETASQQTAHRMTTRARAQVVSKTPSPPPSPTNTINPIHPLFKFPADLLPDRDFGIPAAEAEDTRMLLVHFVQKQEEISRAAADLYMGMLEGDRMRRDVFKWAKAEAHVGEMSDGEDWYDREEWGLDEELVKGRDEEEDEGAAPGKKSTRQRGRRGEKDER